MKQPSKPDKPLTDRQQIFVDLLPAYNWDKTKAALAAGFSKTYAKDRIHSIAKTNVGLCRAIEQKRRDSIAVTEDYREKRLKQLRKRIDALPETDVSNFTKLTDLESKICGWQSQTINLESTTRQRELDERRQALVSAELNKTYALPILPAAPTIDVYGSTLSAADSQDDIPTTAAENPQDTDPVAPQGREPSPYPSIPTKFSGSGSVREGGSQESEDIGVLDADDESCIPDGDNHGVRPIPVSEQLARYGVRVKGEQNGY